MRDMKKVREVQEVKPEKNIGKIILVVAILLIIVIACLWFLKKDAKNPWYCEDGMWITDEETDMLQPEEECLGAADQAIIPEERVKPEADLLAIDSKKMAEGIDIRVNNPHINETIESPLKITGEAQNWYVDDSFVVILLDEDGNMMAEGIASAIEDVTEDVYIKFESEIEFDAQGIEAGDMIFQKSKSAEKPGSFSFPVFFE